MTEYKLYARGLVIQKKTELVLLQKGKDGFLDGVGGELGPSELEMNGINRLWWEASGLKNANWQRVSTLMHRNHTVYYYVYEEEKDLDKMVMYNDEFFVRRWQQSWDADWQPDLRWLLPMALANMPEAVMRGSTWRPQ